MLKARRFLLSYEFRINVFIAVTIVTVSIVKEANAKKSNCECPKDLYDRIEKLKRDTDLNRNEIEEWSKLRQFVQDLIPWKENMDGIVKELKEKIPEVAKLERELSAKLEKVETQTTEVEKELKTEKNKRRESEEEMKKQLQNITVPLAEIKTKVDRVILPRIEEINITIPKDIEQTLENLQSQIMVLNNKTSELNVRIRKASKRLKKNKEPTSEEPDVPDTSCDVPVTKDPHLVINIQTKPDGTQKPKFFCIPLGQYLIQNNSASTRCESGSWSGTFPTCHKLPNADTLKPQEVQNFIPPILIEPKLDEPGGRLGTGPDGQVIALPGSTFTLHCLYPKSSEGEPFWNSETEDASESRFTIENGLKQISLTVNEATEDHTGTYSCNTPYDKAHGVSIVVTVVHCPPIPFEDEFENVFYEPTPEGETRILGATAEITCKKKGKITMTCMANGKWSRRNPEEKDCNEI